jgi:5-methylcytosine-specific restriction endonuclease McrA
MESSNPNSTTITTQKINHVLELEAKRKEKGYAPGWLFYQCKPLGLVEAMEHLRSQGLIESPRTSKELPTAKRLLTIELVPQTCWFSNVRSEVNDEDWEKLRKITFAKAEHLCEVCGGRGPKWPVECHEIWHYDDVKHIQKLIGLTALCLSCHEVKHRGLAGIKGRGEIADQHLAKVNHWAMPETEKYVDEQFEVWRERSRYQWILDISWLGQFNIQPKKQESRKNTVSEGMAKNKVQVVKKSQRESSPAHFVKPDSY